MKTTLSLIFILCSTCLFAQTGDLVKLKQGESIQCLDFSDGTEIPVILHADGTYSECGKPTVRNKIPADATIKRERTCDCPTVHHDPFIAATGINTIQFDFDSSILQTSSYPALDSFAADIKSTGDVYELDGYASSEGTAAHNMRLSKDRANSVKAYLVSAGVPAKNLKVKAFGETHPIADDSTEAGRAVNRRVEFKKL